MSDGSRSALTVVLAALAMLGLPGLAARAAPLDSLLRAIAAEEAAPAERVRLFVQRGDVADVYFIDRIRPGRLRVLKNPRQDGLEMIIIEDQQWLRTASGWQSGPAPRDAIATAAPSLVAILRDGLTNAAEQDEADGTHVIVGDMSWSAPTRCEGKLRVLVERSGRPFFLGFEGECGSQPTVFHQAISYDGGFAIEPPR